MKKTIALGALAAAIVVLVFASIAGAQSQDSTGQAAPDQSTGTDSAGQPAPDQSTGTDSSGQAAPDQSTGTDSSGQPAPAQNTPTVNITNHAFDPAQLTVPAGTTVTWTNNDTEAHTVTADDGLFDSGVLEPGQSYSTWLGGSGTVAYHCTIHPDMQASVVVGGASSGGGTTTGNPASSTPAQTGTTTGNPGSNPPAQTGTTTGNPGSNPPNQSTSVYP